MVKEIKELKLEKDKKLYIDNERIEPLKKELEDFLKEESQMNTFDFSKKVMESLEIKTNNTIEGYLDDIVSIENIIKNSKYITNEDKRNRIINLYKGYQYILKQKPINKDTLKELYAILSKDLLSEYDLSNMGPYYRDGDVYIWYSDKIHIEPDTGLSKEKLDYYMENYFNYLNNKKEETMTENYIKSQIAHFYFVYIHPYFDLNGRCARTTSMWYLLNNKAYPYIIFNRAINSSKNEYYKMIRKVEKERIINSFIEFIMINTKIELEKEYIIQAIKGAYNEKFTSLEFQTILDILSIKGLKTLKDFTYLYNSKNEKKKVKEIYDEMISPLLDKNVLVKTRDTKNNNNFLFEINKGKLDINGEKVRRINF